MWRFPNEPVDVVVDGRDNRLREDDRRECQACHRVNNIGTEIGPYLATIRHRAPEEVLLHILDPNREVAPNFVAYAVSLEDGRVLTGLIVEDTAASITLIRTTGTRETVLRSNIDEVSATGQSLMPPPAWKSE